MVLRRLADGIRNQDWFTVFVELLVVVAGILLALQADAWNEARKDRKRERAHLELIRSDLSYNQERLDDRAEHHSETAAELVYAVSVVKRDTIEPAEKERFKWALMTMFRYPPAGLQTGAYDTLVASGDLALIRDPKLKTALVRLHSYYASYGDWITAFGAGESHDTMPTIALAVPHPSGRGISYELDFESVRNHADMLGALSNERRIHEMASEMYREGAAESAALLATIDAQLNEGPTAEPH